jgi:Family of unknown function (DUF5681)
MSSDNDHRTPSNNYRNPPAEHRYKKGESGNLSGRPPKKKAVEPGFSALGGGIADRVGAMALEEATRLVTVREGDKVSEIPAMQALLRTMFRASAQGNTKAAHQLLELISRNESARTASAVELLQYAAQYKEKYAPVFQKHEREGLDPPDIYPHPDDIIIDETTGEVTTNGPLTKEQAGEWEFARQHSMKSLGRYFEVKAALEKDPTDRELKREFARLKKLYAFFEKYAKRSMRHQALQLSRRALEEDILLEGSKTKRRIKREG